MALSRLAPALGLCLLLLAGWAAAPFQASPALAQTAPLPEYQVKAAFLCNFIKFIDWPGGSGAAAPFCIGILGNDPFGPTLEALQCKGPKGRSVVIRRCRRIEEVKECDLLFIAGSERGRLGQILKQLHRSNVLTVADQEGFCEAGGMINLVAAQNRVSFEINNQAARSAGLRISSQVLKLARSVIE